MRGLLVVMLAALLFDSGEGHAQLTLPLSNRVVGANPDSGGDCRPATGARCVWYTSPTFVKHATLPHYARTYNTAVKSGPLDWSRTYPWRSPGAAPVQGSGCGIAGGNRVVLFNGGSSPPGVPQGFDGSNLHPQVTFLVVLTAAHLFLILSLPKSPTVWKRGGTAEVAFALTANHGGGYSYRLCPVDGPVSEECFQQNPLSFAGNVSWLQWTQAQGGRRVEIPRVTVREGTSPRGSEWARNPVPACNIGQQATCGDPQTPANYTDLSGYLKWGNETIPYYGGKKWIDFVRCGVVFSGELPTQTWANNTQGPPGGIECGSQTQFAPPAPGVSGFVHNATTPIDAVNIVDLVQVPNVPGKYLLSWRWDCEQSPQVWQNCADIEIK